MKKGQFSGEIIAAILAIAFLGVMVLVYSGFTSTSATSEVEDKACKSRISALTRDAVEGPGEGYDKLTNFLNINVLEFGARCKTREVIIEPYDFSSCPAEVMGITNNVIQTAENCVIYDILELSRRCWEMNGVGTLDGYNWACFNAVIGEYKERGAEDKINARVNEIFQCNGENTLSNCRTNRDYSKADAKVITVYAAFLENLKQNIKGKLQQCISNEATYDEELLLYETEEGVAILDERVFSLWYAELELDYAENGELRFLNNYLEYSSTSGDQCYRSKLNLELDIIFTNITDARAEQNVYIDNLVDNYCDSRIDRTDCDSEDFTIGVGNKLGNGLSSYITIDELERVMEIARVPNEGISYKHYFGDNFALRNNEPIKESNIFQITYCDGLMEIWGGIVPSYACIAPGTEPKKILLSNELDAGGARLAGENIEASCPFTEAVVNIIDTPATQAIKKICQTTSII